MLFLLAAICVQLHVCMCVLSHACIYACVGYVVFFRHGVFSRAFYVSFSDAVCLECV